MRVLWGIAGGMALGLGAVGIILPLLPTVPFLLLAAFCFSRSSERLHDWLINHDILGHPIRDWRDRGAINRKSKILATVSIALVLWMSLAIGVGAWVLGTQVGVLTLVLLFIWTRPEG